MIKRFWSTIGTLAVIAALVLPSVAAAQKLTAGWSAVSALNAPFWVMKEAGFFDRLTGNVSFGFDHPAQAWTQASGCETGGIMPTRDGKVVWGAC